MFPEQLTYFVVNNKTVFIPLKFVYPECEKLIEPHPQMYPLRCLREDGCPANMNCMEYLVRRINYIFKEVVPEAEMLIAYYKFRDRASIRGAVFHRDLREPQLMILNPFGFKKFQRDGEVYNWTPSEDYLNVGAFRGIIPVGNLIRGS